MLLQYPAPGPVKAPDLAKVPERRRIA